MGGRGSRSTSGQRSGAGMSAMGSMSSSSGMTNQPVSFQMQQQPPQTVATQQQAVQANNAAFASTDNSGYHDLWGGRGYFQMQNLTISAQMAIMDYIDPNPITGSLYSASQILNTAMATGQTLTAQQTYMLAQLTGSMHNLGYNLNLYRYDHADFANRLLQQAGVNTSMDNVTQADLNKLIGLKYNENRITSTSYNDFKNAPSGNPFTSRQVRIKYQADADVQGLMTGDTRDRNGNLLSWGEMILHPDTDYEIVGARIIGNNARKKGSQSYGYQQIEFIVRATNPNNTQ